jgi:hypothetical protein
LFEDAGQLGLAVGLAAELAVDRRAVQMQRSVLGTEAPNLLAGYSEANGSVANSWPIAPLQSEDA